MCTAWDIVEPDTVFLDNWHIAYLCEWLECITLGEPPHQATCEALGIPHEPVRALAINIPPRYMKSLIVTVFWPVWEWTRQPALRYLFSSYSSDLSTTHSVARRRIIESEWYQRGWPHVRMTGDQNAKSFYENDARGAMISTSTGGMATGQGGDRVVMDDPMNPLEAYSEAKRKTANEFFDFTLSTRLNNKEDGVFVLVMQRLHQNDMTGHVLSERGWVHVCIPGLAEVDERYVFPRSGRVVTRRPGELLWLEREGEEAIERVKTRLGSYGFAGQYQQRPTALEGGMVKRAWLRYWTRELTSDDDPAKVVLLPENLTDERQSWDFGLWGRALDDYSVGLVGAKYGSNVYLLDCDKRRLDLPGAIVALEAMTARHPNALRKLIENTANGAEIVRTMRDKVSGILPVKPRGDKAARLAAVSPMIESGNLLFPHPREAGWVAEAIEELVTFPFAAHDDFCDALSQLLSDFGRGPAEARGKPGSGSGGMLTTLPGGVHGNPGLGDTPARRGTAIA